MRHFQRAPVTGTTIFAGVDGKRVGAELILSRLIFLSLGILLGLGKAPSVEAQTRPIDTDIEPTRVLTEIASSSRVGGPGFFRVGNRTPFPIRLVVLLRSGDYLVQPERAYWDFAPGEGGQGGLVLSVGEDPLELRPGDVVVGFAIDGTGQYWGPWVVGESQYPGWNPRQQGWILPFPAELLESNTASLDGGRQVAVLPLDSNIVARPDEPISDESISDEPISDEPVQLEWPHPQSRTGPLRVGNRTPHLVRMIVAFRGERPESYPAAVHWDFSPGEGGNEGLPLSFDSGPIQLQPGDITMAFSMDGSRRYWGPTVVGESLSPFWDPDLARWSTILQP